jgi:predicted DNA-binding transcriptional regulator AlpA
MTEMINKQAVARMLGIQPRTVDAWEQRGWLPRSVRIGGGTNNLTKTSLAPSLRGLF